MAANIVYKELSYDVVGCAQRVHAALGPGFGEAVYQRAYEQELAANGIPFESQAGFQVEYNGQACGHFRVDLFIDAKIVVELKATEFVTRQHEAQTLAYLKASGARLAMLMNFGEASLAVRRYVR